MATLNCFTLSFLRPRSILSDSHPVAVRIGDQLQARPDRVGVFVFIRRLAAVVAYRGRPRIDPQFLHRLDRKCKKRPLRGRRRQCQSHRPRGPAIGMNAAGFGVSESIVGGVGLDSFLAVIAKKSLSPEISYRRNSTGGIHIDLGELYVLGRRPARAIDP